MWSGTARRPSRSPPRMSRRPSRIPLSPLTSRRKSQRTRPMPARRLPSRRRRRAAWQKALRPEAGIVVDMAAPADYWNHNAAYHSWLVRIAAKQRGDVLDIGCGDGLLAQRLAPVSRSVTGIDPDPAAIDRATARLASHRNVTVSLQ